MVNLSGTDPSHPGTDVHQRFDDPTIVNLDATAAAHTFRLAPQPGEVLQVFAVSFQVVEAVVEYETLATIEVVAKKGGEAEDTMFEHDFVAADANAILAPSGFTPFFLDGDQGDYAYFDHTVQAAEDGETPEGTVYCTLHYNIIKQAPSVSDNASKYFAG